MSIQRSVLERLRKGDEQAFEVVYHAFHRRIYGFLAFLFRWKTKARQKICFSLFSYVLWEARSNIDVDKDFTAYLFTIARNLVYKELREKMTYTVVKLLEEHDVRDRLEADQLLEAESLHSYIVNLLDELPSARKNIFILSRFKHMSNKEIASLLSISEKTVETQIYRTLKFLKSKVNLVLTYTIFKPKIKIC